MKYSDAKSKTKLKPGAIRDAIMETLAYRTQGATVAEITTGVSQRIGPTPPSSVRSYLRLNTPKLFTKIEHRNREGPVLFRYGASGDSKAARDEA